MPDSKVGYLMSKIGELDEGLNQANSRIDQLPNGYHSLGEKETYADLPATGNKVGDSYTVRTADSEHKAGRYVWGTSKGQLVWYYLDGDNDFITETEFDEKIADDLVTDDPKKVLSAKQGKALNEKIETIEVPSKTSDLINDSGFITDSYHDATKENLSNKSETLDSSTTKYPTNKAVKDVTDTMQQQINSLGQRGRFLSDWNATTGMPVSFPETTPYAYKSGDYYVVATVGATNYKPSGTQYTGAASTTVETLEVKANDTYMFDGYVWILQKNTVDLSGYLQTSHNTDTGAHSILFKHDPYSNVYRIAGSDIAATYDADGNAISSTYAKKSYVDSGLANKQNTINSSNKLDYSLIANKPTNVSAFTNDKGYLTQHQSLAAYRTSSNQDTIDATKQPKFVATTLAVTTSQWVLNSGKYVFSAAITGLKTESDTTQVCEISLSAATASIGAEAKIIPSCTTAGTLVLTASYIPSSSVTFNIIMWN